MEMIKWAEKEIEIACNRERGDRSKDEGDYGCACYESAIKAFKSLCGAGHTGCSIGFTKQILNRLIDGKPLTPIEDTEDVWNDVSHYGNDKKGVKYQCKRMSSLFKDVAENGKITYRDIDSCICVDKNTGITYRSSLVSRLYQEMYPITMPYMPNSFPDKIYCEDFLTDPKNGDFDTVGVFYIVRANGEKIEVNRFFKEAENETGWEEIRIAEYEERMDMSKARGEELNNEV